MAADDFQFELVCNRMQLEALASRVEELQYQYRMRKLRYSCRPKRRRTTAFSMLSREEVALDKKHSCHALGVGSLSGLLSVGAALVLFGAPAVWMSVIAMHAVGIVMLWAGFSYTVRA